MNVHPPSKAWLQELRRLAGEETYKEGQLMLRRKNVTDVMLHPGHASGVMAAEGGGTQIATIAWEGGMLTTCTCHEDAPCAHVVALTLTVIRDWDCLDASLIAERVGTMTGKETGRLLLRALDMHPDLWRRLNPPALDADGTMGERVSRSWEVDDDVAGSVAELEELLHESLDWDLRPCGQERMVLIQDILSSLLDACEKLCREVTVESTHLLSECFDHLGTEVTAVEEAQARKGMRRSLDLLEKDRYGLGMEEALLPFAQVLGARELLDRAREMINEGRVPVAEGNGEAWFEDFGVRARQEAARWWPEGDRSEASDRAAQEMERLLVTGIGRRYEVDAAHKAVEILPLWQIDRYLDRMRADPRDRTSWFAVLCARDPMTALRFAGPDVADLEVDMLFGLMVNLEEEDAAKLGAEWAGKRLAAGGTRRSEISRVLRSVRNLVGEEGWRRLRQEMIERSPRPEKVDAAFRAVEAEDGNLPAR
jgi:hypothetical protein